MFGLIQKALSLNPYPEGCEHHEAFNSYVGNHADTLSEIKAGMTDTELPEYDSEELAKLAIDYAQAEYGDYPEDDSAALDSARAELRKKCQTVVEALHALEDSRLEIDTIVSETDIDLCYVCNHKNDHCYGHGTGAGAENSAENLMWNMLSDDHDSVLEILTDLVEGL